MKADLNHYILHWEFFKSTNPKADELFFIEHTLKETKKILKQLESEVDFANDGVSTIEENINNQKRNDFFFHKEYKDFLKKRLKQVKAKLDLKKLPSLNNCVVIHYGCSDFKSDEHIIFWVGAIHHNPNKSYFFENKDEITTIKKLKEFIDNNNDKFFIHWSMNSFKFGFKAIEQRYYELTEEGIDLMPNKEIDLSEYLKNKYGIYYVPRENGRLNNLAKLNSFSGIQSDVEVININDAGNRLELIYSIVQSDNNSLLKTSVSETSLNIKHEKTQAETDLADKIESHFSFFLDDCPRSNKKILDSVDDFNNLLKWTTFFFENKFQIPNIVKPIKNINTNKYITQLAFQLLFDELKVTGYHKKKKRPSSLFILWQSIFLPYKDYKENNFWKVKRKNPNGEDYDTQVKDLMGL